MLAENGMRKISGTLVVTILVNEIGHYSRVGFTSVADGSVRDVVGVQFCIEV